MAKWYVLEMDVNVAWSNPKSSNWHLSVLNVLYKNNIVLSRAYMYCPVFYVVIKTIHIYQSLYIYIYI